MYEQLIRWLLTAVVQRPEMGTIRWLWGTHILDITGRASLKRALNGWWIMLFAKNICLLLNNSKKIAKTKQFGKK